MGERLQEGKVGLRDLTSVLGRLCFAMGPLEHLRPVVAPLFAWTAAARMTGFVPIPWSVRFILKFLMTQLGGVDRMVEVFRKGPDLGVAFRADAKAEGQLVRIGGWECRGGIPPGRARWFGVTLTRANAPGLLPGASLSA